MMGNSAQPLAISFAALLSAAALLPQAAASQPVPSYAQRSNDIQPRDGQETITGTISLIKGEYLEINDDRGYVDRVDFTTETTMRPSRTLRKGMRVTISGYNQGQIFDAYVIDTGNAAAPTYGGNAPSYGYDGQAPGPVPMTAQAPPPPPEPAPAYQQPAYQQPAYQQPAYQQQALPPYATPVGPQGPPVYAQPVYAPQPVYVPYPVYAYPPPYAYYPRFYVRFGGRFR